MNSKKESRTSLRVDLKNRGFLSLLSNEEIIKYSI
jgi:hypothetical protein